MELPDVDAGTSVYLKHTDHFAGAVEGWSDAEIISQEQRQAIGEAGSIVATSAASLQGSLTAREAAERQATKLRARFTIRDIILDKRIMGASDALLNGPAMRDRAHPVYRTVFQGGTAGDITDMRTREEPEEAADMRDRFASVPDFDGKTRAKMDLDEALSKSFNARDDLDNAESTERKAGDAELQARLAVRAAIEKAYGILRAAFPGQRKLVESFFYRAARRSKSPKGGGAGPQTP
ncbi:MAG: hypothetical protein IPM54_16120 [Polyangiaceae bacterium]|nr:hypothetical protein [Polyangiaceae bacterium]